MRSVLSWHTVSGVWFPAVRLAGWVRVRIHIGSDEECPAYILSGVARQELMTNQKWRRGRSSDMWPLREKWLSRLGMPFSYLFTFKCHVFRRSRTKFPVMQNCSQYDTSQLKKYRRCCRLHRFAIISQLYWSALSWTLDCAVYHFSALQCALA